MRRRRPQDLDVIRKRESESPGASSIGQSTGEAYPGLVVTRTSLSFESGSYIDHRQHDCPGTAFFLPAGATRAEIIRGFVRHSGVECVATVVGMAGRSGLQPSQIPSVSSIGGRRDVRKSHVTNGAIVTSLLVAHSRPLFFFFADYPLLFRHGREAERRLERLQDGHEGGKLGPGL